MGRASTRRREYASAHLDRSLRVLDRFLDVQAVQVDRSDRLRLVILCWIARRIASAELDDLRGADKLKKTGNCKPTVKDPLGSLCIQLVPIPLMGLALHREVVRFLAVSGGVSLLRRRERLALLDESEAEMSLFIPSIASTQQREALRRSKIFWGEETTHHEIPLLDRLVSQGDVVRVLRIGHVLILRFDRRRVEADQS